MTMFVSANSEVDSLFVKLNGSNGTRQVIGVIYRPPNSDIKLFLSEFEIISKSIACKKTECLILAILI
jgi:hypothetical protein